MSAHPSTRPVSRRGEARRGLLAIACMVVPMAACATTPTRPPPRELLEARAAFTQSEQSATAALSDQELAAARSALERAEWAFTADPRSERARDLAYVARRGAQQAESLGNRATAADVKENAERSFALTGATELRRSHLAVRGTEDADDKERVARALADRAAASAMASLARGERATVEPRGLVINLPGLLFESAGTSLLGNAEDELRDLARALKSAGRSILVEGHTDSRGAYGFNKELSLRRAQAVRDFIVAHGAPAEAVRAVGLGPDRAVGDNATAKGRASNRRVEIVVEPLAGPPARADR